MGFVDVVLLVLLVWTFTADCKDDEHFSITCDNVTGHVGKELPLACRVSYQSDTCCMLKYMFKNMDKDTEIYTEEFNKDPCIQFPSITHPYTANEVMKTRFMFFLQTECGPKTTEFTVNITDAGKGVTDDTAGEFNRNEASYGEERQTDKSALAVILSVLSCFTIIVVTFILKRKRKNTSAAQMEYNEGVCVCENKISKHTDIATV